MDRLKDAISFLAVPQSVNGRAGISMPLDSGWSLLSNATERDAIRAGSTGGVVATDGWRSVQVPGDLVLQGVPLQTESDVCYLTACNVPTSWSGHRLRVRFDAVYGWARVFFNGTFVGEHRGGFIPFEVDVTDAYRWEGANVLSVLVSHDATTNHLSKASQYASHDLRGITRNVRCFATPREFGIGRPCFTGVRREGVSSALSFTVPVFGVEERPIDISAQLLSTTGEPLCERTDVVARQSGELEFALSAPAGAVHYWTSETPILYDLTIGAYRNGSSEIVTYRFGVREITVHGSEFRINQKPVTFRGVCRHDVHPEFGRAIPVALMRKDVALFKEANVNYIRTSHYPPAPELLDACNEAGVYVELELPVCWMYGFGPDEESETGESPRWEAVPEEVRNAEGVAIKQLAEEVVAFYRPYTSVVLWSIANESMWTPPFEEAARIIRAKDPSRPRTFNWALYDDADADFCEVGVDHYPGAVGPKKHERTPRPVLFDEFTHIYCYNRWELETDEGLRDRWGALHESMWNDMYNSPTVAGGAIWSGIDEWFLKSDSDSARGYGEWGIIDGYRRRKPEFHHVKQNYAPVRVHSAEVVHRGKYATVQLHVENRHDFLSLSDLTITLRSGPFRTQLSGSAAPGQGETLEAAIPSDALAGADETTVDFIGTNGVVILSVRVGTARNQKSRSRLASPDRQRLDVRMTPSKEAIPGFKLAGDMTVTIVTSDESAHAMIVVPYLSRRWPEPVFAKIEDAEARINPFADEQWVIATSTDERGIAIEGRLDDLVNCVLHIGSDRSGRLTIDYEYSVLSDVDLREAGVCLVHTQPIAAVRWNRETGRSAYPLDHIGRDSGTATASPCRGQSVLWKDDDNGFGSRDLCSTRTGMIDYGIVLPGRGCVSIGSPDKTFAARTWHQKGRTRTVVLGDALGGSEWFLRGHVPVRILTPNSPTLTGSFTMEYKSCVALSSHVGAILSPFLSAEQAGP